MEQTEDISVALNKPDIEAIKAEREAYIREYVATERDLRARGKCLCGMSPLSWFKCNTCDAIFDAARTDARYCPACCGSDLKVLSLEEITEQRIDWRVYKMVTAQDKAEIKELWDQKSGKRAIADKLGISISEVSEVVGIKQRRLPQETIDYIRIQYLSGRSEQEIKERIGRISEKRVSDVTGELHKEIMDANKQGIRPEDIGEAIGICGHDQAIIDIVQRGINFEAYIQELTTKPPEEVSWMFDEKGQLVRREGRT
jgi:hypothetical protein